MNLNTLLSDLAHGELSNLAMATEIPGTIREVDKPKIVRCTNDALLRLYSLFVLREKNVVIEQVGHITHYHFLYKFAQSNQASTEPYKYIKDLQHEIFQEDVIRIMEVRNREEVSLPLNDQEDRRSVFTPQANRTLQVPHPIGGQPLFISYQARHREVTLDHPSYTIYVPEVLYLPLRLHIAYQVYSSLNTQEATAKAQEHLTRFDMLCAEAVDRDLVNSSVSTLNTKFRKRGFV